MGRIVENGHTCQFIPLDVVLDYPVNWAFWKVLRDLIQNFYDSIGYEHFHKEFEYSYVSEENSRITLVMGTKNHPFSFEWLTYIGGSTKTGKDGYIGSYGEGFKICALCLMRMGCRLTMESQGWLLVPYAYMKEIDGRAVEMLGYQVWDREDDGITQLTVHEIPCKYEMAIREALLNFFYPENPLFGKKIADTDDYAVYERSNVQAPYLGRLSDDIKGILYFHYLARGRMPFPLIILAKRQKNVSANKRDRNILLTCQVTSVLYQVAEGMTPEDSYEVLTRLEDYWSELPKPIKNHDMDVTTWYFIICQLVRNVSRSEVLRKGFLEEYLSLVWLERVSSDTTKNRKIRAAREWYQASHRKERIVNPVFRLLGVPSLLKMHHTDELEMVFAKQDERQTEMGRILNTAFAAVVPEDFSQEAQVPALAICSNYKGSPMAFCKRIYGKNTKGTLHRKYQVEIIIMDPNDYGKNQFYDTFIKYATARFRAFGTDRSAKMTALLTDLGSWMFEGRKILEDSRKRWEVIADEN